MAVMAPNAYNALLRDPDWKASHALSSPDKIWRGEVEALAGIRVVRSNAPGFLPYTGNTTSGTSSRCTPASLLVVTHTRSATCKTSGFMWSPLVARLIRCNSPASWVGSSLSRRSSKGPTLFQLGSCGDLIEESILNNMAISENLSVLKQFRGKALSAS